MIDNEIETKNGFNQMQGKIIDKRKSKLVASQAKLYIMKIKW